MPEEIFHVFLHFKSNKDYLRQLFMLEKRVQRKTLVLLNFILYLKSAHELEGIDLCLEKIEFLYLKYELLD